MKFGNSDVTVGQQILVMGSLFPQFWYQRKNQSPAWLGVLTPSHKSPEYRVEIFYPYPSAPKVWIKSPSIVPNAPHRFSDESLCLHYPPDRSWHRKHFIAETTVPWTAEWLTLYEIWLLTGEWYGDESPHTGKK